MSVFYLDARKRGNNILLRYMDNGVEKRAKVPYKPSLFRKAGPGEDTKYVDLVNKIPLTMIQYDSLKAGNQAIMDARASSQELYGNRNFNYTFLHETFENTEDYDSSKIRVFNLDIECPAEHGFPDPAKAEWEVNALCVYDNITDKYYVWGLKPFNTDDPRLVERGIKSDRVVYRHCPNESSLLKSFVRFWAENTPVAYTGWYTSSFDLPYLINRMRRLGVNEKPLSPWGVVELTEKEFNGRIILLPNILGVNDLDYLDLYKKNRFITRSEYKLGFIGDIENVGTKIDFSEEAQNLRTLHKVDWQLYVVYNIIDVDVVKRLDDKLGFMETTFAVAYFAGVNYGDVKSPVATWSNIMYRNTIEDFKILPPVRDHDAESYEGGYVKSPQVGKHRWVVAFDLNSLYPHLIEQYNISPETITDVFVSGVNVDMMEVRTPFELPEGDLAVAPSGNTFRRDELGIAGKMMNILYSERKIIKRGGLEHEQHAINAEHELKLRGLL